MDTELSKEFQKKVAAIKSKLGNRPVYLTGMMCSGKTVIGQKLADLLMVDFADADNLIVGRVEAKYPRQYKGLSKEEFPIQRIFKVSGEPWFRARETNTIRDFAESQEVPSVLALGGGAFINDQTRSVVKESGVSIFLNASVRVLNQRLISNPDEIGKRPLLSSDTHKRLTQLQELIVERKDVYGTADVTVDAIETLNPEKTNSDGSMYVEEELVDDTVIRVVEALHKYLYKPQQP